ncbi:MAG: DUF2029 domain-containing protein [Chloroflexota bacterium]|nr:DUF2029 domain-containing protein [Chloroflexota bacterium]
MRRAGAGALVAATFAAVLALAGAGWPGRDYRSGDFFQYYAGAAAVASGASPYDTRWWTDFSSRQGSTALHNPPEPSSGDAAWTTPYPLHLFVAILPIALMPLDLAAALWLVAQALCIAVGLAFVARQLLTDPRRDGLLLSAIALAFQPLWLFPGNGNLTGFLFGAVAGAVGMTLRGRPFAAGAFLAVCSVKPQSLVLVAIALVLATPARDRLRMLEGSALIAVPLLATAFALQPGWIAGWLEVAAALQRTHFSNATGWTIDRIVPGTPVATAPIAVAAAVAVLGAWWWRVRPAPAWAVAAAIPVSVFAAPHGWTYEQLYLLISAAVIIGAVAKAAPRTRTLVLVAVAAVFGPIPWALYAWDLGRNGEEPSAAVPLLVFGLVLLVRRLTTSLPRREALTAAAGRGGGARTLAA